MLVLSVGDMIKLKDLLVDYKFLTSWEDEIAHEGKHAAHALPGLRVSQDSAVNNLLNLMISNEESELIA